MTMSAQRPAYSKMSPHVRRVCARYAAHQIQGADAVRRGSVSTTAGDTRQMMLLARITGNREKLLERYGGRLHAQLGGVSVVSLPMASLADFSQETNVRRMEASGRCSALLDTTVTVVNASPVYAGTALPQAYTGKGIVMGVMDIGFDLTHPTFYNNDGSSYRIKSLWDQLDNDSGNDDGSGLPIGKDYVGMEALLALKHSYDGREQSHGTHTAGAATGSGYDSPYRGLAYESDICLVANATTNNANLIPDSLLEMYNSTMDILGFKYIFDYAESVSKPCVISFSEGSTEDLVGEDKLIYEALDALTGPGRIIVASAGNTGNVRHYFRKPEGTPSAGSFVQRSSKAAAYTLNTTAPFDVRMVVYSSQPDTIMYHLDATVTETADTLALHDGEYVFAVMGNPSPYYDGELSFVVSIVAPHNVGYGVPLSVEVIGEDADVELFATSIDLTTSGKNASLAAGDTSHGIHSPGSAPGVICVGATTWRKGITNWQGDWKGGEWGDIGKVSTYSSRGPTFDRRVKPDVVAPGTYLVSAYSSYHYETAPSSWDASMCTSFSEMNSRRYGWTAYLGTSMSTPVVGGAVALWLEANPTLTPADILDIIAATSRHNDPSLSYPNNLYGYGEIDVYAGLVEALRRQATGLSGLSQCQPSGLSSSWRDGQLTLTLSQPASGNVPLRIYSVSGVLLTQSSIPAGSRSAELNLATLPQGVYAIQLSGAVPAERGSLLVRR